MNQSHIKQVSFNKALDFYSNIENRFLKLSQEKRKIYSEEISNQIRQLYVDIHSFKDWISSEYPQYKKEVENMINESYYMALSADFANTLKHKRLTKPARNSNRYVSLSMSPNPELFLAFERPKTQKEALASYTIRNKDGESVLVAWHLDFIINKWKEFLNNRRLS